MWDKGSLIGRISKKTEKMEQKLLKKQNLWI